MSGIASRTLRQVVNSSRTLLRDFNGAAFTDGELLELAALVQGEIQDEFAKHGLPIVEKVNSTFTYTTPDNNIPIPTLVTDTFQAPLELWESPTDSGGVWFPMERVATLPAPYPQLNGFLGAWEWRDGAIYVLPCSSSRDILCRYRAQLAYPTQDSTTGGEGFYWALVYGTAYSAAVAERPQLAASLNVQYRKRTLDAIQIAVRDRQVISFRQQSIRNQGGRAWPYITQP